MSLINDVIQHREKQKRKPKGREQPEFKVAEDEWDEESPRGLSRSLTHAFTSRGKWLVLFGISALGVCVLSNGINQSIAQAKRWVSIDPFYQAFGGALETTYALLTPNVRSDPSQAREVLLAAAQSTVPGRQTSDVSVGIQDEFMRSSTVPPLPAAFSLAAAETTAAQSNSVSMPEASVQVTPAGQAEAPRPKLASLKTLSVSGASSESAKDEMMLRPLTYTEPKGVMQLLSKTQALHRIGGSDEAIRLLLTGIQQYPNTRELRAHLASIYLDLGQLDEAERTLQMGMRLDAKHLAYARLLARVYASKQQLPEAITLLIDSAPSMNEEPEHYSLLAALYQQQGRHDLASQLYWELLSLYPDSGRWWTGLGISLEANKAPQMALESYAKALGTTALEPKLRMFVNQRVGELSKRDDIHRDFNLREAPVRKG
ncbi:MAG: tetratricopeptide repeat protein [Pseudomonadota bacterium]